MKAGGVVLLILLAVDLAVAQTKVSGTVQCGKADQQQSMNVGDRANHSFIIGQGKCTWIKPLEIEGAKTQNGAFTVFSEQSGNTVRDHGYVTDTLDSGDKYTVRINSTETWSGGKPVSERGTWNFASGTGKMKGIKGKGTFNGKAEGDNMLINVEGEYQLPK